MPFWQTNALGVVELVIPLFIVCFQVSTFSSPVAFFKTHTHTIECYVIYDRFAV